MQQCVHGDEADTNIIVVVAEVNEEEEVSDVKVKEEVLIRPIDPGDPPKEIYHQVKDH